MQYLLMLYTDQKRQAAMTPEDQGRMFGAYMAYTEAMKKSGAYLGGNPLQPVSTATTVRGTGSAVQVLDGPYAETKEQLAGYYLIDVENLDAALDWAKRCPATDGGVVEVRPIRPMPAAANA